MSDSIVTRGRPKNDSIKKGKSSWKPASVLDVTNKEDGFRYRWSLKTPDNLAKKNQEGWETVSALQAGDTEHTSDRIADGKKMTTVYEKHDVILQRIPEELAQERDAYYNAEAKKRVSGLTAHLKKDLAKDAGARVHGSISLESRTGTQVID